MSIHDFRPLITQTPERTSSGEAHSVTARQQLGRVGTQEFSPDTVVPTPLLYLPTHETLQYGIDHIHSVVLVEIDQECSEVEDEIARIEKEIAVWEDKRQALIERIADLGLFRSSIPLAEEEERLPFIIGALTETRNALQDYCEDIKARRMAAMVNLEELEQFDFELLTQGR